MVTDGSLLQYGEGSIPFSEWCNIHVREGKKHDGKETRFEINIHTISGVL